MRHAVAAKQRQAILARPRQVAGRRPRPRPGRPLQPGDHHHQRGLAGAGGAGDGDPLARARPRARRRAGLRPAGGRAQGEPDVVEEEGRGGGLGGQGASRCCGWRSGGMAYIGRGMAVSPVKSLTRRGLGAGLLLLGLPAAARAAPGERIVTLLGDSITAGYGLSYRDSLPAQLQGELRRLGVAARVRGAGVSGDTTAGGLARLDWAIGNPPPDRDRRAAPMTGRAANAEAATEAILDKILGGWRRATCGRCWRACARPPIWPRRCGRVSTACSRGRESSAVLTCFPDGRDPSGPQPGLLRPERRGGRGDRAAHPADVKQPSAPADDETAAPLKCCCSSFCASGSAARPRSNRPPPPPPPPPPPGRCGPRPSCRCCHHHRRQRAPRAPSTVRARPRSTCC